MRSSPSSSDLYFSSVSSFSFFFFFSRPWFLGVRVYKGIVVGGHGTHLLADLAEALGVPLIVAVLGLCLSLLGDCFSYIPLPLPLTFTTQSPSSAAMARTSWPTSRRPQACCPWWLLGSTSPFTALGASPRESPTPCLPSGPWPPSSPKQSSFSFRAW